MHTLISSIDWYQRQLMSCFFYVADDGSKPAFPSLKTIAQYGKHEVMGMLKVPFYERKGDASGTDGYLGYPYKHGLRYQFRYGNSVKLGFVASQDAGEPFFGGRNTLGQLLFSFKRRISLRFFPEASDSSAVLLCIFSDACSVLNRFHIFFILSLYLIIYIGVLFHFRTLFCCKVSESFPKSCLSFAFLVKYMPKRFRF